MQVLERLTIPDVTRTWRPVTRVTYCHNVSSSIHVCLRAFTIPFYILFPHFQVYIAKIYIYTHLHIQRDKPNLTHLTNTYTVGVTKFVVILIVSCPSYVYPLYILRDLLYIYMILCVLSYK